MGEGPENDNATVCSNLAYEALSHFSDGVTF